MVQLSIQRLFKKKNGREIYCKINEGNEQSNQDRETVLAFSIPSVVVTASVGLVLLAVVVSLSSVVAVPPAVVTASVGVVLLAVDVSVGSVVGVT